MSGEHEDASRPRRRLKVPAIVLALIVAVGVAGGWLQKGIDVVANPWAHPIRGKTLTGTWVAAVRMPGGLAAAMLVDLRRAIVHSGKYKGRYAGSRRSANIEGEMRWCDATGLAARYGLTGQMNGGELTLGFLEPPGLEPGRTLVPTRANGAWEQSDTLRVATSFSRKSPGGLRSSSADPATAQPLPVRFHRGDVAEFQHACEDVNSGG